MYDKIDLVELKRMADLSEAAECFNMRVIINSCGTAGCLIGTWLLKTPGDRLRYTRQYGLRLRGLSLDGEYDDDPNYCLNDEPVSMRFNIGRYITNFLFFNHYEPFARYSVHTLKSKGAMFLDQQQAVARLRKYIRYVEDQRRRWANHEWLMALPKKERRKILMAPLKECDHGVQSMEATRLA
jgi:hypothetical protein